MKIEIMEIIALIFAGFATGFTACNLFYSFKHKIMDFDTYAKAWQCGYDTAMEEVESEIKEATK
jgi:hypothetical protein